MDVADASDSFDWTLAAEDDPALVNKGLVEPAAEHLHGELAVGGDAADHAAKLVHMGVDHDAGAGGAELGDHGAHAVIAEGDRGEGLHLGDDERADGIFIAWRTRGVGETLKELNGGVGLLGEEKGRGGEQPEGQQGAEELSHSAA